MDLEGALHQYFGYTTFRAGQKEIISDVLAGKDVFATLPTGSGKSICYLLPGYLLAGTVVIVSPLLSLMEDQVQQLKAAGEKRVIALNSFLSFHEKKLVLKTIDRYRFIFVSPEILQSKDVLTVLKRLTIRLFVIDEAHCISQWGHEFRTDYLKLKDVRKQLGSPPLLALTATATPEVQQDILHLLALDHVARHIYSVDRENIAIIVKECESVADKLSELRSYVKDLKGPGVIYCATRNWAEQVTAYLKDNQTTTVATYHAGLTQEERMLIQQQFLNDQLTLICATNAFGMGVNKPNIRFVIHFHYPARIESYLQEIGRAGRDGMQSVAVLLYCPQDQSIPRSFIKAEYPDEAEIAFAFTKLLEQSDDQLPLSETKLRFLTFHFEKIAGESGPSFPLEKAKKAVAARSAERIRYKQNKLTEIESWLQESTCRRTGFLACFDEILQKNPPHCCDNCGLTIENLALNTSIQSDIDPYQGWEAELHKIFHRNGDSA